MQSAGCRINRKSRDCCLPTYLFREYPSYTLFKECSSPPFFDNNSFPTCQYRVNVSIVTTTVQPWRPQLLTCPPVSGTSLQHPLNVKQRKKPTIPPPKPAPSARRPSLSAMPKEAGDFFKGLVPDNYLHKLSEKDVYCQLIDCYRMRVEDDYRFAGDPLGLYDEEDPLPDFKHFLDLAEKRTGLLPKWWKQDKRMACERLAVDSTQWSEINSAVEKADVIKHYGDNVMPMKLRLLAEKIYGKKIDMGIIEDE